MRPTRRTSTRSLPSRQRTPIAMAVALALALALGGALPAQAQSFTQSGANSTSGNPSGLPFAGDPTSLNFGTDTIYIANGAPGSFSALAGAQLTAGVLSIATGGVAGAGGSFGDVTFDGINQSTGTRTTVLLSRSLDLGSWGTGTLTVSGGALLDATRSPASCPNCFNAVGNAAGSTGTLNITGNGSQVNLLGFLNIGQAAVFSQALNGFTFGTPGGTTNAYVNVLNGGKLISGPTSVGVGPNLVNNPASTGAEKAFGTVVVDGNGSQWAIGPYGAASAAAGITIGNRVGGDGSVTVRNGGKLLVDGTGGPGPNDYINIGVNGGKGSLTVTGAGSTVDILGFNTVLQVGRSSAAATVTTPFVAGDGTLSVLDGATASAVFMNVGRDSANGKVLIDGIGSTVTMSGLGLWSSGQIGGSAATIGWNGGSGEVTVSNGGRLRVTDGGVNTSASAGSPAINLGYTGGTGKMFIDGIGSVVEIVTSTINPQVGAADNFNAFMAIGRDGGGTGELTISGGGKLLLQGNALSSATFARGTTLNIGGASDTVVSGSGMASVSGPGSEIRVEGADAFIAVGRNANGTLSLSDGARVVASGGGMNVGRAASGVGTLNVDHSFVELSGQFTSNSTIGAFLALGIGGGSGTAIITNGSLVTINNAGSAGAALVLGGTSTRPGGHGELSLSGGSKINVVAAPGLASMTVGYDGTGVATITGVGSQINLGDGTLHVGQQPTGNGTLNILAGGKLLAGTANFGGSSDTPSTGGTATVKVSGAGSEIVASGDLARVLVGHGGTGSLTVDNGGAITAKNLTIGRAGTGVLNADNATINLSGEQTGGFGAALSVGNRGGSGTATINNSTVTISNGTAAGATLNVGGSAPNPLGTGTLNLTGGTTVNINAAAGPGAFNVGYDGNGTANLSDAGTTVNVNNGGAVYVGRQVGSTGVLNISDGAVLNAGFVGVGVSAVGTGRAPATSGGIGQLNIGNGVGQSAVHTGRFEVGAGGTVNVNAGGTLNISSLGSTNIVPALDRSVYVAQQANSTGTLVLGSLSGASTTLQADFVGIGVNAKAVDNAGTLVQSNGGAGTLVLNNATVNATHFELGKDSLLTGNGDIRAGVNGPVIIGGTIAPGNSPGRIRIYCDVTMLLGSQLILEIDGNGINAPIDQLVIGNDSKFDLTQLQIIFAFVGDTDPTKVDLNLNRFLRTSNTNGTGEDSLETVFGDGQDWGDVIDSNRFAFQSSMFDVTNFKFNAETGRVTGIEASAIPEPATYALVLLALGLMVRGQRRAAAARR